MSGFAAYGAASGLAPVLLPAAKRIAAKYIASHGPRVAMKGIRMLGKYASQRSKRSAVGRNALGGGKKGNDAVLKPDRANGKVIRGNRRRRGVKRKLSISGLNKTVKRLARSVAGDQAKLRYQLFDSMQTSSNVNSAAFTEIPLLSYLNFEAALSKIPYLNTAAPGTAVAYIGTTLVHPTNWHFSAWVECNIRNNWYMPVKCKAYICTPKIATSVAPGTALGYISKQAVAGAAAPAASELGCYPWSVPDFMDTFKIVETKDFIINAGDEFRYTMSKAVVYDQEMADNHANTYLPNTTYFLLLRQEGIVCHDNTTTTNVGISSTKLDIVYHVNLGLKYASNQSGNFWVVSNSLDNITTSAITGTSADLETQ